MSNVSMPLSGPGTDQHLLVNLRGLNDDQTQVLTRMIEKFIAGCHEHGRDGRGTLDVTSKRWGPELMNELIDSNFYLMFELMRVERLGMEG